MKKSCRKLLVLAALLSLFLPGIGRAADKTAELEQKLQALAAQLQALQSQLQAQKAEIETYKQALNQHRRDIENNNQHLKKQQETLAETRKEQETLSQVAEKLKVINEHVTLSGLVEVEAFACNGYDGEDESDITLATVELGIDVNLHKFVSGHLLFLWEEDDTEPVDIDEGYIYLGNTEFFPAYLQVGKLYVPFGNFESNMISDPLTLELGETRESAALLGFESHGFYAAAYAFNGDIDEQGDDNEIKCYGLNGGYAFAKDDFNLDVGAGWINNIADSENLKDLLPSEIEDYVAGWTAHAIVNWKGFSLIGEYLAATDDFENGEMDWKSGGAEPEAWNLEAAYSFDVAGHETVFALAWQGTDEALALELPEDRYMGCLSVGLIDGLTFSLEYAHDEDYSKSDGGTGDNADTVTTQLSLEF
jgi:outer membrane murein-binding lipoprotein Lpp